MKSIDKICVVVQARLNSQRIEKKMIRPFADTTLMDICIKKILDSKVVDKNGFYLSLYEGELKDIAKKYNANIFHRSRESAFSEGTPMTLMYEWWNKLPYDYCILVNACAPFLKASTIDNFIKTYMESDSDGMFGVVEKKNYFWNSNGEILTPLTEAVMNTKTVKRTYEAAHCLYAGRMDKIGQGVWMGNFNNKEEIELFSMEEEECLDIDYEWQFQLCEQLFEAKKKDELRI